MADSLDLYCFGHLRGYSPRDLRAAALLIEAEDLAAQVRQMLPGATAEVLLNMDMDETTTTVEHPAAPSGSMADLGRESMAHLLNELRELPGEPGLRRFLNNYPYGYL
jgi:hypothetical protein